MAPQVCWTQPLSNTTVRVDAALAERVDWLSRSSAQRLVRERLVTINGTLVTRPSHPVAPGDVVDALLPDQPGDGVVANPAR